MRAAPRVPGLVVVALCSVSFFFGHFAQQAALLPEPAVLHYPVVQPSAVGNGRALKAVTLGGSSVAAASADAGASKASASTSTSTSSSSSSTPAVGCTAPSSSSSAAATAAPDVFNLTAWEAGVAAQLQQRKPRLQPGESGEAFYRTMSFQILSWYPRIVLYPNFIDRGRAAKVIKRAQAAMYPSGLAYRPGEKADSQQQVRTSTGTFLASHGDSDLDWLEKRVAAVTQLPQGHGEAWNVLNYKNAQHYDSHYDTFDPKEYGAQPSQRVATVIVVLSDVGGGGETVFKKEGKRNADKAITNYTSCHADGGFVYKPRMGDALLFWDVRPNGEIDPHALHGGCPVTAGDKWVAVKWIRSKGADY